jgi:large subunit ribosomal protein L4
MKIPLHDLQGQAQGEIEIGFSVIENGKGTQAVHDAVVAYRAHQRSGTACTKTMGEVAGTGKKPWRQKGTGRARAGSFQSPLWRGGGVVFGPKPREFEPGAPKRVRQLALRKALSERLRAGDVRVVEDLALSSPKTKAFLAVLSALQLDQGSLLIVAGGDRNLRLASRNVNGVELASAEALHAYQVLRPQHLLFTRRALEQVSTRLADAR